MTTSHYILVADDDATIRRFLVRAISRVVPAVPVVEAANGLDALHIVQSYTLLLVITDYHMPGANGLQVVQAARLLDPLLPIIVVSAHVNSASALLAAGANYFLPKPVTVERLTATIRAALALP